MFTITAQGLIPVSKADVSDDVPMTAGTVTPHHGYTQVLIDTEEDSLRSFYIRISNIFSFETESPDPDSPRKMKRQKSFGHL